MTQEHLGDAIDTVRRFCDASFPGASLVLLCGSWARGQARADSDLDVIVVDPGMSDILCQAVTFDSWLIEVCALPPARIEHFFGEGKQHRSAPVVNQVLDAIIVSGDKALARQIRETALRVLRDGPNPLSDVERLELRWGLTALLNDLAHVTVSEVPAVAAQCHTALARASLDSACAWRGERKALRQALVQASPALAERLDQGLIAACQGDRQPLFEVGQEVLAALGGTQRTYVERY